MDLLTAFGLFAVTAMLVCYALEDRSPYFILAFARSLRARLNLRLHAGRIAVRGGRDHLGSRGLASLAKIKSSQCNFQIRPLRVKPGQYPIFSRIEMPKRSIVTASMVSLSTEWHDW